MTEEWKEINPAKTFVDDDEAQGPAKEVPKDLADQYKSAKMLTTVHELLHIGNYPIKVNNHLIQSIKFIEEIHKNVLTACLTHADAGLIPELRDINSKEAHE